MSGLNAHGRPPEDLKAVFKHYQGLAREDLDNDTRIVRDNRGIVDGCSPMVVRSIDASTIQFEETSQSHVNGPQATVLEWTDLPGLQYIPSLLSHDTQLRLLSRMLHRDLANPQHQTNVHKHYIIPHEVAKPVDEGSDRSFFNACPRSDVLFQPLDPTVHKPFPISKFLNRKLRWMTLGGQYDWTEKVYPKQKPLEFPLDIADLVRKGFPDMLPQAAIVNVYSPGDTLALHRDVSEVSENGLVSVSIGCEAIFVAGLEVEGKASVWRAFLLRSGDAIYMSGVSRYAWHGVPKIFKDTCPEGIRAWPADSDRGKYEQWRGWMEGKRINLNVRQMFEDDHRGDFA